MNQAEIFLPGFAKFLRGGLRASLLKLLEASISSNSNCIAEIWKIYKKANLNGIKLLCSTGKN